MKQLPHWVKTWWNVANRRRHHLIVQKHSRRGISQQQDAELSMLQKVAEAVMEYVDPMDEKMALVSHTPGLVDLIEGSSGSHAGPGGGSADRRSR